MGRLAYSMSADQPLRGVPIREGDLWHLSTEERETARAVDAGSFGAVGLGGGSGPARGVAGEEERVGGVGRLGRSRRSVFVWF